MVVYERNNNYKLIKCIHNLVNYLEPSLSLFKALAHSIFKYLVDNLLRLTSAPTCHVSN